MKGPWTLEGGNTDNDFQLYSGDWHFASIIDSGTGCDSGDNARLMAASPELHTALTHCLDALYNETHGQEDSHWIKEVKEMSVKALEKARGTQQDGPYAGSLGVNKEMLALLQQFVHFWKDQMDDGSPINGCDCVDYTVEFYNEILPIIKKAR